MALAAEDTVDDAYGPVVGTKVGDALLLKNILLLQDPVSRFVAQCIGLARYAENE